MAPAKGGSSNSGNKNPHFRQVHGKLRWNPQTNVPSGHAGCPIAKQAKINKEMYAKYGNPPKVYTSKAKGMFYV